MLTPTKLDKLPEPMVSLMSKLQDDIIADICRRITKADYLTPTAEWQLYKANQLQLSSADINKRIAKQLKVRERTVKELYTDAVKTAIHEDAYIYRMAIAEGKLDNGYGDKLTSFTRSVAFSNVLKQGLAKTNGLMRNLTGSTAATANRQLSDALDLAYLKVSSGAFSPAEAIFSAVKELGSQGLKTVTYTSGRTDQIDVAVRRAVLTGIGKTCCDMQLALADDMDCELVEVSSHIGARPTHAEWQGQIFSLKKGHPKYPYFYDATGYGRGDGLGGWNCRHSFFPFFEGISMAANAPDFTKAENLLEYQQSQQQRAHERGIRKTKRELTALEASRNYTTDETLKAKLDKEFSKKSVTLKSREAKYTEFCTRTGNYPDGSRVRVDGFNKSVSQKAVWANKQAPILSDSGYKHYPVTNKSISSVRFVEVDGLTRKECKQLQKAHRDLLREVKNLPIGVEASATYSLSMKQLEWHTDNKVGLVSVCKYTTDYIALHNHPDGLHFSYYDIRQYAYKPNQKILTAVGNNGSVYVLNKTEKWSDLGFINFVEETYAKYPNYATSVDEALKCTKEILKGATDYGVQYTKAVNK